MLCVDYVIQKVCVDQLARSIRCQCKATTSAPYSTAIFIVYLRRIETLLYTHSRASSIMYHAAHIAVDLRRSSSNLIRFQA